MIDAASRIWAKIQEFMMRIDKLERETDHTKDDVKHLERELELSRREAQHDRHVNKEVQKHLLVKITEIETRLKKVEKEKHGAKVSAGIARKQLEKLKEELKPPPPKRRH